MTSTADRPGRPRSLWSSLRADPPPSGAAAEPAGFSGVRFMGDEDGTLSSFHHHLPARRPQAATDRLRVLVLSGGGAGGAFGAGALVGLSRAGQRPAFDMVTGVSTGALIAPFAFLGEAWDQRLTDAYTDGHAAELLALRGLRPGLSLYASEPLSALVRRYIDEDLLAAVADAHAAGRRLFVATANLDAQRLSIWDMGAIAAQGGPAALQLFADVLIASASLPGMFPPKMISVQSEGQAFEEMHVDGGAVTPLFVVPEPLILRRAEDWAMGGVEVHVLVNTRLEASPRTTPLGAVPILMRSFELLLRSSYRSALRSVAAFCAINGFDLKVGSVPLDVGEENMLRFDRAIMSEMFAKGAALSQAGGLWAEA